jgi:lysyl-tRNA synthetase class 2
LEIDVSTGEKVAVSGRVVFARNTGKLCFATLQAGDGERIQAMVSLDKVGEQSLEQYKELVDLGDHLFVEGEVITSKRGELSILVENWKMAAKTIRPLPNMHNELENKKSPILFINFHTSQ